MIRIYGPRQSRASRCLWLLEEMGKPYELVPVDIAAGANRESSFLALSPAGKVPVLELDGFVLSESHAINLWLAQREGDRFWPVDPAIHGRILQWTIWTGSELEAVTNQILRARRSGDADAESLIARLQATASSLVGVLEVRLQNSRFLACDDFGVADIGAGSVLSYADFFGIELKPFPRTLEWLAALKGRPAYRRVYGAP